MDFVQKRVLAVHDLSGVGKCSLTVALPIISAAGVECSALPTAILSTHTGGFTGFTYRDLTEDITPMMEHWQGLNIQFHGIYTGFLGSFAQIDLMKTLFQKIGNQDTITFVDPVMADNGKLYSSFDMSFPPKMLELCQCADVVLPNFTEVALLLGEEYVEGPYTKDYIEGLLERLAKKIKAQFIVLTGVYFDEKELGAAVYARDTDSIAYILGERIEGYYHGTGDVFGSFLVGAYLSGKSMCESVRIAVDLTVKAIKWTQKAQTEIRYGVNFERYLGDFSRAVGL